MTRETAMKKRAIFFSIFAAGLLSIIVMLVSDFLKGWMPWSLIVTILLLFILIIWFIKGNAIFHPSFYRSYRTTEVHVIEVPEELREKVFGKPKIEGRTLDIKSHVEKRREKKKRFEL